MATPVQTHNEPIVNPRRWTTKVNIALVIGVILVMIIGAIWTWGTLRNPEKTRDQIDKDVSRP